MRFCEASQVHMFIECKYQVKKRGLVPDEANI